jgi:hypothetical protein
MGETVSIPTASTGSPESLRTPPQVPQAPVQSQRYGSKVSVGGFKAASTTLDDLSIFKGDPFGLDDILRFPSHFRF